MTMTSSMNSGNMDMGCVPVTGGVPHDDSQRARVEFVCEYIAVLMGAGVHTSRTVRNSRRIAGALGLMLRISSFQKSFIIDIIDRQTGESHNRVVEIPSLPISFEHNSELSILSWEAVDDGLPFCEIERRFREIVARPRIGVWVLTPLVGVANASFCRIFGGDWVAMAIVFVATVIGFAVRTVMQARRVNHYVVFICSAFMASFTSASALLLGNPTADVAISTSVLFLVPGVPLINGVIDILEGYIVTGFTRLASAGLLIISLAIGLSLTLWIVKSGLL